MEKLLQKLGFLQTIDFDNYYRYYYRPMTTGGNLWFRCLKDDITDSVLYIEIGGDQSAPVRKNPTEKFITKLVTLLDEE